MRINDIKFDHFENIEELTIMLDSKMGEGFNKLLNERFCNKRGVFTTA